MNYKQATLIRKIETILLFPFIEIGKLIAKFYTLKGKHQIFLFFPNMDIGGSPKVNIDIINTIKAKNPLIIFCKKPNNNGFSELFKSTGCAYLDLHILIDNKYFHFINVIYRGILAQWINKTNNAIVFGGECIYFYKILPYLNNNVKKIELSHLSSWLNYNQKMIPFIDLRISSTPKLKRAFENQYQKNGVPQKYLSNLLYIDNFVEIPKEFKVKQNPNVQILFVGRGAPQKRVHLISAIADKLLAQKLAVEFIFVGDVLDIVSENTKSNCKILEFVNDKNKLSELYNEADILILTSAYEGLPIVVMEMMARAKVVLSTAVDGIPDYIKHNLNGILINEINDEKQIIDQACIEIKTLVSNRTQMKNIGLQARKTAIELFDKELFINNYNNIFKLN